MPVGLNEGEPSPENIVFIFLSKKGTATFSEIQTQIAQKCPSCSNPQAAMEAALQDNNVVKFNVDRLKRTASIKATYGGESAGWRNR